MRTWHCTDKRPHNTGPYAYGPCACPSPTHARPHKQRSRQHATPKNLMCSAPFCARRRSHALPRAASPERKTRTPSLLQPMNFEQKAYVPGSDEDTPAQHPRALLARFLRLVPPARPPQWQVDPFLLPAHLSHAKHYRKQIYPGARAQGGKGNKGTARTARTARAALAGASIFASAFPRPDA